MPTRRFILPFLYVIALLVCAQRASGISFRYSSVEWLVADSELVARCRSVEVSNDESNSNWKKLAFEVTEVLKGEPVQHITILTNRERWLNVPASWDDERIFFFQRTDPDARGWYAQKESTYPYRLSGVISSQTSQPDKVLARMADLRELKTMPEVEAAVRNAIASPAKPIAAWITDEWESPTRSRENGPLALPIPFGSRDVSEHLLVPLDSRLESMSYGKWPKVIRYFPSEQNVELLKKELSTTSGSISWTMKDSFTTVYYENRAIAFDALQSWGVEVKRPVIRAPDDCYIRITLWTVMSIGALILLSLTLISRVLRRKLQARRTPFRVAIFDALTLVSVVSVLLLALHWIDKDRFSETTFADLNARYLARLSRQSLSFSRITQWPECIPLSVASYKCPELRENVPNFPSVSSSFQRSTIGFKWRTVNLLPRSLDSDASDTAPAPKFFALTLPIWTVMVLLMILPGSRALIGLRRGIQARRRSRAGLCRKCGYDLRSGHDRCPECGSISTVRRSPSCAIQ